MRHRTLLLIAISALAGVHTAFLIAWRTGDLSPRGSGRDGWVSDPSGGRNLGVASRGLATAEAWLAGDAWRGTQHGPGGPVLPELGPPTRRSRQGSGQTSRPATSRSSADGRPGASSGGGAGEPLVPPGEDATLFASLPSWQRDAARLRHAIAAAEEDRKRDGRPPLVGRTPRAYPRTTGSAGERRRGECPMRGPAPAEAEAAVLMLAYDRADYLVRSLDGLLAARRRVARALDREAAAARRGTGADAERAARVASAAAARRLGEVVGGLAWARSPDSGAAAAAGLGDEGDAPPSAGAASGAASPGRRLVSAAGLAAQSALDSALEIARSPPFRSEAEVSAAAAAAATSGNPASPEATARARAAWPIFLSQDGADERVMAVAWERRAEVHYLLHVRETGKAAGERRRKALSNAEAATEGARGLAGSGDDAGGETGPGAAGAAALEAEEIRRRARKLHAAAGGGGSRRLEAGFADNLAAGLGGGGRAAGTRLGQRGDGSRPDSVDGSAADPGGSSALGGGATIGEILRASASRGDALSGAGSLTDVRAFTGRGPKARQAPAQVYASIARHYGSALRAVLDCGGFPRVLVVEDDMEYGRDFFPYFRAMARLLEADPTLLAASAWNDHGQARFGGDPRALHRTDFFPGLGWMMQRDAWASVEADWPESYWDDWMRLEATRKGRQFVRPEVCRTYTFGEAGSSAGQYYDDFLKPILLNAEAVGWESEDLSYLEPQRYHDAFLRALRAASHDPAVDGASSLARRGTGEGDGADPPPAAALGPPPPLPPPLGKPLIDRAWKSRADTAVLYGSKREYERIARVLKMIPDWRDAVPRASYRGVVVVRNPLGARLFIAPVPGLSLRDADGGASLPGGVFGQSASARPGEGDAGGTGADSLAGVNPFAERSDDDVHEAGARSAETIAALAEAKRLARKRALDSIRERRRKSAASLHAKDSGRKPSKLASSQSKKRGKTSKGKTGRP